MKKFSAILFLFIISIQCLPVKQLGKCLFDSSFVEEDCCKKVDAKKFGVEDIKAFHFTDITAYIIAERTAEHIVSASDDIFPGPSNEVMTPPPNA